MPPGQFRPIIDFADSLKGKIPTQRFVETNGNGVVEILFRNPSSRFQPYLTLRMILAGDEVKPRRATPRVSEAHSEHIKIEFSRDGVEAAAQLTLRAGKVQGVSASGEGQVLAAWVASPRDYDEVGKAL